MTNDAAVVQLAPQQWLIWPTTSVFVMTPAKNPSEPHTTTRSVPARRSLAASINGASSAIVTSFERAAGINLSTSIALSLLTYFPPRGPAQIL
jgi:hypothetical protein